MKDTNFIKHQDEFLSKLAHQGKSFNTIKNYKTDLNIFNAYISTKNSSVVMNEITTKQMQEYSRYLNQKYSSPNSIRRRVQALRMFFDFLIEKNIYQDNPVKKITVSPKVVDLPKPPEFHIVKRLYESLTNQSDQHSEHEKLLQLRNQILIHLIYGGGLKVSDIERLKNSHINEAKGLIRILIAPEKREPYTLAMPKSFTSIYLIYQKTIEQRKKHDEIEFEDFLFNANPFKILKGGLSARGIEVIFKEFSKNIKPPLTAKSLRQACIFKWLIQEKPESRIKEWMGVQPQYSLKPYKELLKAKPTKYCYLELNHE